MKKTMKISGMILCVALFLAGAAAFAAAGQEDDGLQQDIPEMGHRYGPKEQSMDNERGPASPRPGPPREAIDACSGKGDGDKVEFATPRGDMISGTCREIRGLFAAVPDNGPPRGRHSGPPQNGHGRRGSGPPPEAVNACSGRTDGDKVEFEMPGGRVISGTCREMNNLLFAVPEPPSPGEGVDQPGNGKQ